MRISKIYDVINVLNNLYDYYDCTIIVNDNLNNFELAVVCDLLHTLIQFIKLKVVQHVFIVHQTHDNDNYNNEMDQTYFTGYVYHIFYDLSCANSSAVVHFMHAQTSSRHTTRYIQSQYHYDNRL